MFVRLLAKLIMLALIVFGLAMGGLAGFFVGAVLVQVVDVRPLEVALIPTIAGALFGAWSMSAWAGKD